MRVLYIVEGECFPSEEMKFDWRTLQDIVVVKYTTMIDSNRANRGTLRLTLKCVICNAILAYKIDCPVHATMEPTGLNRIRREFTINSICPVCEPVKIEKNVILLPYRC